MGVDQIMTMRTTIARLSDKADAYGQKTGEWKVLHLEIPCYVWQTSGSRVLGTAILEAGTIMMILSKDIDVTSDDRIESVIDRRGNQLYGKLKIDAPPTIRRNHKELRLKRIA